MPGEAHDPPTAAIVVGGPERQDEKEFARRTFYSFDPESTAGEGRWARGTSLLGEPIEYVPDAQPLTDDKPLGPAPDPQPARRIPPGPRGFRAGEYPADRRECGGHDDGRAARPGRFARAGLSDRCHPARVTGPPAGMRPAMQATATFIGNATVLLRIGDFTLLTDPAFGPAGSRVSLGNGLWTKRLRDPVLGPLDDAGLDAILLSHLHGDHFDRAARRRLDPGLPIITTPQAERRLRRRFRAVRGLPTWDSHEWTRSGQRLRVTAVPGRHGPGIVDALLPDVMGSVVEFAVAGRPRLVLYITGDTLYRPELADIPRRFPAIEAMLIHLGGTRVLGLLVTMDDRQGTRMTRLIKPARTIPIHYDDYRVMKSPLQHYLARTREEGVSGVQPVGRGETVDLPLRLPGLGASARSV
jgi:L-ascorbate metabolism protein UlaG (beta-lactamase superfamily)